MIEFSLSEALNDQSILDRMSEQQLDELIREYPYASWLHVLKAIKKKRDGSLTDSDVHRAAMYTTDRSKLYEWLELELPILQEQDTVNSEEDIEVPVEEGPMIEGKVLQKLVKDGRVDDPEEFIEEDYEEEEQEIEVEVGSGELEIEERREEEEVRREEEEVRSEEEEVRSEEEEVPEKTEETMVEDKENGDLGEAWSFIAWLAEHRSGTVNEEVGKGNKKYRIENRENKSEAKEDASNKAEQKVEIRKEEIGAEKAQAERKREENEKPDKKKKSGTKKVVSKKSKKKKKKPLKKLIERSIIQDHDIASEPLADLLSSQGHTQQAIEMYERLSLIFPEKSAFFAQKIKKLKKK